MWTGRVIIPAKLRGAQQELRMAKLHCAARRASLPVEKNISKSLLLSSRYCGTSRSHLFVVSAAGCDASESANANSLIRLGRCIWQGRLVVYRKTSNTSRVCNKSWGVQVTCSNRSRVSITSRGSTRCQLWQKWAQ